MFYYWQTLLLVYHFVYNFVAECPLRRERSTWSIVSFFVDEWRGTLVEGKSHHPFITWRFQSNNNILIFGHDDLKWWWLIKFRYYGCSAICWFGVLKWNTTWCKYVMYIPQCTTLVVIYFLDLSAHPYRSFHTTACGKYSHVCVNISNIM